MEITQLEKELIQLAPSPIYIKQTMHEVKVNEVLAKQISKTLMKYPSSTLNAHRGTKPKVFYIRHD